MTLITFQDGKPVMRDGKIGTEQDCCCEQEACTTKQFICHERVWSTYVRDYCEGPCSETAALTPTVNETDPTVIAIAARDPACILDLAFACPGGETRHYNTYFDPAVDGCGFDPNIEWDCGMTVNMPTYYERYRAVDSCEECESNTAELKCSSGVQLIACYERGVHVAADFLCSNCNTLNLCACENPLP